MAPPDFSLSLGDIEHIADLARLELAASEAEHMHAQLSHFFKFVAQIQAVDTHGIEPLVYPVEEGCTPRLRNKFKKMAELRVHVFCFAGSKFQTGKIGNMFNTAWGGGKVGGGNKERGKAKNNR